MWKCGTSVDSIRAVKYCKEAIDLVIYSTAVLLVYIHSNLRESINGRPVSSSILKPCSLFPQDTNCNKLRNKLYFTYSGVFCIWE